MVKVITILFIVCCFLATINCRSQQLSPSLISIDHVPVVVKDLDDIKEVLSHTFHFKVKEGKEHEGIRNCFIKFQDGTFLEFITPVDTLHAIGKYYTERLKHKQGGTELAVSVANSDAITRYLTAQHIPFEVDSNSVWKTISPKGFDLFFIDYKDKAWRDTEVNTKHPNEALRLNVTYILSMNVNAEADKYKSLGFKSGRHGVYLDVPYRSMIIGKNELYLLDASQIKRSNQHFTLQSMNGIRGFEIEVSSLTSLNNLIQTTENMVIEKERIIYFLKDCNVFFVFTERQKNR